MDEAGTVRKGLDRTEAALYVLLGAFCLLFVILMVNQSHEPLVIHFALGLTTSTHSIASFRYNEHPWWRSHFFGWVLFQILLVAFTALSLNLQLKRASPSALWLAVHALTLVLYAFGLWLIIRWTAENTRRHVQETKDLADSLYATPPTTGPS